MADRAAERRAPGGNMKGEILAAATRLFAQRGFAATSLQAIADEVGIRKPSLLYHFSSKARLREAVIEDLLAHWQRCLPGILAAATGGVDRFDALIAELNRFFRADPNRARLLLREAVDRPEALQQLLDQRARPWFSLLTEAIRSGQQAGRVAAEVDPEAWLFEVVGMVLIASAIGELSTGIWTTDRARPPLDRHLTEIMRIARSSLFVPTLITEEK